MGRPVWRVLLTASIALYVASLTQNAFCVLTGGSVRCDHYGVVVVATGWIELIEIGEVGPFSTVPWFANLGVVITWIFVQGRRRRRALVLGGASAVLALSFLLAKGIVISAAGGDTSPITAYGPGYWFWLGSICLAFGAALTCSGARSAATAPAASESTRDPAA